ncbi:MAG: hypothetical protein HC806_07855 [Anaerolineae bacterium]|nr:hypothetical protein [Anaerolineae bacterium]
MTIMMMHLNDPVPDIAALNPDVPGGLRAIIAKSLAKDPKDRYQSGAEMAADLRGLLTGQTTPPPPMATMIEQAPPPTATIIETPTTPPPTPTPVRTPTAAPAGVGSTTGQRTTPRLGRQLARLGQRKNCRPYC